MSTIIVMSHSEDDAAQAADDAERMDTALLEAGDAAVEIAHGFEQAWEGDQLHPSVSVDLTVGGEDQPVIVFLLLVELDDDLDSEDYPADDVARLQRDLRERIPGSPVDDWDWIVSTGTKAGATA